MSKNQKKRPQPKAAAKQSGNAPVKTVKTAQRKCMFEYIAVNVLSLFVFLSFGYIAIMAFFQTCVIDPDKYVGEHILFQDDILVLNIVFTVIIFIALFGLKTFISKRIEDDQKMRRIALAAIITAVGLTVLFMLITVFVQYLEIDKEKGETISDALVKALDAPTSSMFFPMNFLLMALFIGVMLAMFLTYSHKSKHVMWIFEGALAAYVLIIGIVWVVNVQSIPAADSMNIYGTATDAANGIYTLMHDSPTINYNDTMYHGFSYYNYYPFQLGFVAFSEFVYRIFGTESSMPMQIINVLSLASAYFALARITRLLFKSRRIEFISIIMLMLCIQPILFCTFVYGNIIGMSCAIWASLFIIKYFQTDSYAWIFPSGCLLILSVLVKYNNMIYLVAFVIMLVIHIVKKKKWQSAVIAAAMIIAVILSNTLVKVHYENRADVKFDSGVTQTMYLNMGLQENDNMAQGWYSGISKNIYRDYYLEPKAKGDDNVSIDDANSVAKNGVPSTSQKGIYDRLDDFSNDPGYMFDFFGKKILSQWNEPTFESIWISKVKNHTANDEQFEKFGKESISSAQTTGLTKAVYEKSAGQALELHFNLYMQIMYILFAAGIYLMFINRKTNIESVLLPLVLLGAFGYHLLFEGKSQYVLTYIPLLIPTAAYALHTILNGKYKRIKKVFGFIKHIPERDYERPKSAEKADMIDISSDSLDYDVTMRAD